MKINFKNIGINLKAFGDLQDEKDSNKFKFEESK